MANNLPKDYKLKNDAGAEYIIKEIIGSGASTIAYIAVESSTNQSRVLKEYYPSYLRITRNDDGSLQYEDGQKEKFEKGKERFVKAVETQNEIRTEVGLTNLTPPVLKIFRCNNTIYQDVIEFKGKTFDKIDNMPLLDRMRICLSISKVVERYHNAGYLCLDLKPSNILVLDSTARSKDVVNFIDFDSICKKDELEFGDSLSYTESWSAPEQRNPYKYNKISEHTDIYTIGEIVFWCTFNRNSFDDEHRGFSTYPFGENKDFSKELGRKQVQKIYTKLFRNTLRSSYKNRYSKVGELIDTLEELVSELEKRQYIITSKIRPKPFFVGREQELKEIDEALAENDIVFVSGIAGIGKSELIKQYVSAHKCEFDNIMWFDFKENLEETLADDMAVSVEGMTRNKEDSDIEYCKRKINRIKSLLGGYNILVVDNVDFESLEADRDIWKYIQSINTKIIMITKCKVVDYYNVIVNAFSDIEYLREIYRKYSMNKEKETEYFDKIIEYVGYNTLLVELIAKQSHANYVNPKQMIEKLYSSGISDSSDNKIRYDSGEMTIIQHISRILPLSELNEKQIMVLLKAIFSPADGLEMETFQKFWSLKCLNEINELENRGWIQTTYLNGYYYISVHSAIAISVIEQLRGKKELADLFLNSISCLKAGYDDDSVRVETWNKLLPHFLDNGFDYDFIMLFKDIYIKRNDIDYKCHVYICDTIAQKIMRYSCIEESSFRYVAIYCKLFMKYGNVQKKIELMRKFKKINLKSHDKWVNMGIYVDLLIDAEYKDEAIEICNNGIKFYDNDIENQLLWNIRMAKATFGRKEFSENLSKCIRMYFKYKIRCLKTKNIRPEVEQGLAQLYEMMGHGVIFSKKFTKQIKGQRIYAFVAWFYRNNLENGDFKPSDNYIYLKVDLALVYFYSYKFKRALKVLSEITEKYETEEYSDLYSMFYVYGLMGEVYLELEQWDDSDYCMSKAIDISSRLIISDDFRVRCMYGNICLIKHRLEESEKILTELANDLQYNSKYQYWLAETYFQLGELKLQMYDYAKAEEFYSKAREIYSNLKSAYIINQNACYEKIAEIKFANSDYQGAVKNMEMAIYSFQKYKERNEKVPKEYRKLLKQYKSYI